MTTYVQKMTAGRFAVAAMRIPLFAVVVALAAPMAVAAVFIYWAHGRLFKGQP